MLWLSFEVKIQLFTDPTDEQMISGEQRVSSVECWPIQEIDKMAECVTGGVEHFESQSPSKRQSITVGHWTGFKK